MLGDDADPTPPPPEVSTITRHDHASKPSACASFKSGLFSHRLGLLGLLLLTSFALAGCGTAKQTVDPDADIEAIKSLSEQLYDAFVAHNWERFAQGRLDTATAGRWFLANRAVYLESQSSSHPRRLGCQSAVDQTSDAYVRIALRTTDAQGMHI